MNKFPEITSASNEKVAWLRSLHKSGNRREQGVFIVEGAKEINFALKADLKPHSVYFRSDGHDEKLAAKFAKVPQFSLSTAAFERIVYRESEPSGMVAVFNTPKLQLADIKLSKNPFIIIVEAVEKPGNLGAVLRIADGCGADAVILANQHTDIYNPNAIRSSVGTIFSKQIAAGTNQEVKQFCQKNGIKIYAAALTDQARPYTKTDFTVPCAIALGTEADGLSDFWLQDSTAVFIPMLGQNDSLNVSAAAAVLAYEVLRQRS